MCAVFRAASTGEWTVDFKKCAAFPVWAEAARDDLAAALLAQQSSGNDSFLGCFPTFSRSIYGKVSAAFGSLL